MPWAAICSPSARWRRHSRSDCRRSSAYADGFSPILVRSSMWMTTGPEVLDESSLRLSTGVSGCPGRLRSDRSALDFAVPGPEVRTSTRKRCSVSVLERVFEPWMSRLGVAAMAALLLIGRPCRRRLPGKTVRSGNRGRGLSTHRPRIRRRGDGPRADRRAAQCLPRLNSPASRSSCGRPRPN